MSLAIANDCPVCPRGVPSGGAANIAGTATSAASTPRSFYNVRTLNHEAHEGHEENSHGRTRIYLGKAGRPGSVGSRRRRKLSIVCQLAFVNLRVHRVSSSCLLRLTP
jgi:hypothetical protein